LIGLLTAIIIVVAVGTVLIVNQRNDRARLAESQPTRSEPPPNPTPPSDTPPPPVDSPGPTPKPGEKDPQDYLSRNPLLAQTMSKVACTVPLTLPTDPKAYEAYFTKLFGCAQNSYRGPVTKAGFDLPAPALLIYGGTVSTPCGAGSPAVPAFYCPPDQTIYVSTSIFKSSVLTFRLGTYYLAYHEYAHHIQRRILTLDAGYSLGGDQLLVSRRIELQADCFSGIHISTLTTFTAQDWAELKSWREYASDGPHGQTASQLYWLDRGFKTNEFKMCNTWAGNDHVD
jgi:uncharacterized protein